MITQFLFLFLFFLDSCSHLMKFFSFYHLFSTSQLTKWIVFVKMEVARE